MHREHLNRAYYHLTRLISAISTFPAAEADGISVENGFYLIFNKSILIQ